MMIYDGIWWYMMVYDGIPYLYGYSYGQYLYSVIVIFF